MVVLRAKTGENGGRQCLSRQDAGEDRALVAPRVARAQPRIEVVPEFLGHHHAQRSGIADQVAVDQDRAPRAPGPRLGRQVGAPGAGRQHRVAHCPDLDAEPGRGAGSPRRGEAPQERRARIACRPVPESRQQRRGQSGRIGDGPAGKVRHEIVEHRGRRRSVLSSARDMAPPFGPGRIAPGARLRKRQVEIHARLRPRTGTPDDFWLEPVRERRLAERPDPRPPVQHAHTSDAVPPIRPGRSDPRPPTLRQPDPAPGVASRAATSRGGRGARTFAQNPWAIAAMTIRPAGRRPLGCSHPTRCSTAR